MKTLISTSSDLKGVLEGLFQIKMKNIGQQHEKIRLSLVTKLCREIQNTEML
jgi:phage antirepressor YoqD-like protein